MVITEENKTLVLLTYPTEKWRTFIDAYATQNPVPLVDVIFRTMKALEEMWNTWNDREIGKANCVGRGGGGGGGDWKPKTGGAPR